MADAKNQIAADPKQQHVFKSKPDFPHKGCGHRSAKKERHRRKGSGTPGSTKPTCKTTWQERWACRGARSYRSPDYAAVMRKLYKKAGSVKGMQAFAQ